jgi:hypothetical protein
MNNIRWMAALLLFLFFVGCGGGTTATVSGKVIYQGEPVTAGYVAFYGVDGKVDSGRIDADGHYTVYKAPVGDVKVAVLTADPTRKPPSGGLSKGKQTGGLTKGKPPSDTEITVPERVGKFVAIPAHYKNPDQSGLAFTVKSGAQTIDLELNP